LNYNHEISGVVEKGPSNLEGKSVIIPAVMPCGECDLCKINRSNICQKQKMPEYIAQTPVFNQYKIKK